MLLNIETLIALKFLTKSAHQLLFLYMPCIVLTLNGLTPAGPKIKIPV